MGFPLTLSMNDWAFGILEINIVAVPPEIPAFVIVNPPTDPESVSTEMLPACAAALATLRTAQAAVNRTDRLFMDPPVRFLGVRNLPDPSDESHGSYA
jgi:hypothetical protein